MKYVANVISENPNIEEELTIEINGVKILCFVEEYQCPIKIGESYLVDLDIVIFDELELEKSTVETRKMLQVDNSFAYWIIGIFNPSQESIDSGLQLSLHDEDFSDFWYLENQYVKLKVDRINLSILEKVTD